MTKLRNTVLALSALSVLGCNELEDPSFDLACAGETCAWRVTEGEVRHVSTWNEHDKALELLSTPTTLSQRVESSLDCALEIEVFGLVEPGAELSIAIDANDDGTLDDEAVVRALDWDSMTFRLDAGASSRWRLEITKQGKGRVVLGHVLAEQCPD